MIPASTLRSLFRTVIAVASVAWGLTAAAQTVPSVDKYRLTTSMVASNSIGVTGLPGSVSAGNSVTIFNVRTWAQSAPVTPAADGSFAALIGGVRGDRVSVVVSDAAGNNSAPTIVFAGALTIKNPYQASTLWRVGQGHTHTTNSDGVDASSTLEAAYKQAGYDFVVSTDHRGWPSPLYTAADDGMTYDPDNGGTNDLFWIRGAEIGNSFVHLGSWGTWMNVPLNSIPSTQNAINATRNLGGIAVINHPENVEPPYAWDWHDDIQGARDVSLIEAFNGKHAGEGTVESHISDAIDLADEFQQVWWIGTDDCHDVNDPVQFNQYAIVAQADVATMNQVDLLAAADSGRIYIRQTAQGPAITSVSVTGNTVQITLPDGAVAHDVIWYKRGNEIAEQDLGVGPGASYTVQGSEGYIRAQVIRRSDGKSAWTQPLFIGNNRDLSVAASAAALIDNNSTTLWDAGDSIGSFTIDAGSVRTLNAIRVDWDSTGGRRFNYQVEVSDTGEFAGEQRMAVRRTYSNRQAVTLDFFDVQARYVRVVVTSQSVGTAANARVREVELYDSTPARTPLYLDNVNGNDANTGLAGSPWRTFDHARDLIRPRDTLNFLQNPTPYPGGMQIRAVDGGKHAGATVEFRGAGASPAVVDATGDMYGVTISQAQWVEWHNFDMANASNANVFVDGGYNNVVQGNRLRNAGNRGVLAAGDFTLAYNLVYGNSADGVFVYQDVANTRIYNNVLYGNGVGGVTIQNQGTPKAVIRNNITQANGQYAFSRALNSTVVDSHNCGQGAYNVAGAWTRSGNVAGDPKFLDPASGNFALQLTSPCIDAGIDLDYNADFAGDPIRDVATTPNTGSPGAYSRRYVDMGAFEACGDCNSGGGCH